MSTKNCDILAFAPHPDDAELGCGGYLALATEQSQKAVIVDLTAGELASQGDVAQRAKEAAAADLVLGLQDRHNLGLPDGQLSAESETQLAEVVACIRSYQPSLLLAPYWESRHPDHAAAAALVTKGVFFAALKNYKPELGSRFQVPHTLYYAIRRTFQPSFVVDVTATYDKKRKALACYASQVQRNTSTPNDSTDPGPLISSPLSLGSIEARDRFYGSQIGVMYGEGFAVRTALSIKDPLKHFQHNPITAALLYDREW